MLLQILDALHVRLPDGRVVPIAELDAVVPGFVDDEESSTLILPAELCGITELTVSRDEARLLHKTLPWRLEEIVLTEAEQLHLGAAAVQEGRAAVSYIDKPVLAQILEHCAAAGVVPKQAYAELSLVPWQHGQWSLWLDDTASGGLRILAKHQSHRGFVCDADNVGSTLQIVSNEQQSWPEQIVVYGSQKQFDLVKRSVASSLQALLVLRRAPAWAELISSQTNSCNVLQGEFAPALPWRKWRGEWRIAATLVIALLLGDMIFTFAETRRINAETAQLSDQTTGLFRSAVPQGELVDAVAQLREQVTRAGGNGQMLLPLLTQMAPALQNAQGTQVQSMDFNADTGELQLQIQSVDLGAAEALRSSLQSLGLQAELLGSSSDGAISRSRLRVRRV